MSADTETEYVERVRFITARALRESARYQSNLYLQGVATGLTMGLVFAAVMLVLATRSLLP